ncbi:MAG: hypothetical protein CMM52_16685 [Rhodospirillaceae bacterium]|mgnify:CR=1 FL=1|nr:hypothetical protein [Rhodospirillaceae bacterium]|tara:strand:- start:62785 stop:63141 length:357 start_codon:yes stop_codon:yes gene_type:complete
MSPRPSRIKFKKAENTLEIAFDDGAEFSIPAELLRVESPSAEVQGHGMGQKKIVSGRRHVSIMEIEPVGNYAIRLIFDDLHDTGIFSWSYLYELGKEKVQKWSEYITALEEAGLSRDP